MQVLYFLPYFCVILFLLIAFIIVNDIFSFLHLLTGKLLTCRPVTQPLELKQMCLSLRSRPNTSGKAAPNTPKLWTDIPDSAIDLLKKLLDPFPDTRITATQALVHDFFQE